MWQRPVLSYPEMDLTLAEHKSHIISKKSPDPISVLQPVCTKTDICNIYEQ